MKNFIFKSNASDLQKMFQSIETIQKNVLYVTYRIDMLIKRMDKLQVDNDIHQQSLDYYKKYGEDYDAPMVNPEDTKQDGNSNSC